MYSAFLLLFIIMVINALKHKWYILYHVIFSIGIITGSLLYYVSDFGFWALMILGVVVMFFSLMFFTENSNDSFHIGFYKTDTIKTALEQKKETERLHTEKKKNEEKKRNLKSREEKVKKKEEKLKIDALD